MLQKALHPNGAEQGLMDAVEEAPWFKAQWADMANVPAKRPTRLDGASLEKKVDAASPDCASAA